MVSPRNLRKTSFTFKKLLLFCFFATTVLLIVRTIENAKGSDEWILEGLFPYFLLFALSYSVIVILSPSVGFTAIITSLYLMVINLIPNLKYDFIYGTYDPLGHYGFISEISRSGHIPLVGVYKDQYGSTPGVHIFSAILSQISGLSISIAMKLFLVVLPVTLPLLVYLLARKIDVSIELGRMAIICTAFVSPTTYIFTGTTSTYFLYVPFIYLVTLFFVKREIDRQTFVLGMIAGFPVLFSHDATSFFLMIYFAIALVILMFLKVTKGNLLPRLFVSFSVLWIVILSAHFLHASEFNFSTLLNILISFASRIISGQEPKAISYYGTFFNLSFYEQIGILIVSLGRDALTVLLFALSLPLIIREGAPGRENSNMNRFYGFLSLSSLLPILMFVLSPFVSNLKTRYLCYFLAFSPFFAGLSLSFVASKTRKRIRRTALVTMIFGLVCFSILQTYPFQPLVPKIETAYGIRYTNDYREVNTDTQLAAIRFLVKYDDHLKIAANGISKWQMYGLTNATFQGLISNDDPTSPQFASTPIVLISLDASKVGKQVVFYERYVLEPGFRSLTYSNGESFALLNETSKT